MTDWLAPLGILVIAGVISAVIGEGNAHRGVILCAGVISAVWIVRRMSAPAAKIAALAGDSGGEYITPLVKGVGIAWAAWLVSLALREMGEANAASVAELVGAAELVVIASPFVVRLVTTALSLV